MNISEFAESRNQKFMTVYKYIERNKNLFEGHIKKVGKNADLDDEAIEILDKKYPLPKPVNVINGIDPEEHYKEVQDLNDQIKILQAKIIELQEINTEKTERIGDLQGKMLLIEEKNRENEDLKQEIDRLKNRNLIDRILNK